ncbi:MAG: radical SAM protein [Planctomycetota bacterium]|nr:radical SAM protein [Planctomycetota bacterium]
MADSSYPRYLETYRTGELRRKVEEAIASLADCTVCPRNCHINRLEGKTAVCHTARNAQVGSFGPHFGEEDCLRGWNGSGTIFFSQCNLRCVFCQNWEISWGGEGKEKTPEQLAWIMLYIQDQGCHNINFVTPEHVVPQVLEAILLAVEGGLRVPLVYNTSAYDSAESLRHMDGVIDIYMPDFKFWDADVSRSLAKAKDYPDAARRAILEMHRQVGDLVIGEDGIARHGLLVRHLVMPNGLGGTREIMRYLYREVSPYTYVNVMDQYRPVAKAGKYPEINRRPISSEIEEAMRIAREEGITRFDERLRSPLRPVLG